MTLVSFTMTASNTAHFFYSFVGQADWVGCWGPRQGGGFGFIHDILATEHYLVALENPMRMDFWKMLSGYALGRACLAECLCYDAGRRSKIHLIPRPGRPGECL